MPQRHMGNIDFLLGDISKNIYFSMRETLSSSSNQWHEISTLDLKIWDDTQLSWTIWCGLTSMLEYNMSIHCCRASATKLLKKSQFLNKRKIQRHFLNAVLPFKFLNIFVKFWCYSRACNLDLLKQIM